MDAHPKPAMTIAASASVRLREINELPGPRGLPLVGNLLQVRMGRMHQTIERWADEYGPFFRFELGGRRFLGVADHEAVAAILRERPGTFRRSLRMDEIWREIGLDQGVFGANGDAWRGQRRMVMAGFDPSHVRDFSPQLVAVAQRLQRRWQRAARAAQAIDLKADLTRFTVDAIAGLAFGTDVNTLESDSDVIQHHLDKIYPAIFRRAMSLVPYWRYVRLPSDWRLQRSVAAVNAGVNGFIANARHRLACQPGLRERPRNLLEAMLVAADQPGSGLTDRDVAGNVLTMLLAGEDTTANTLSWLVYLLARNPQALRHAQDEVRRVAGEGPASFTLEQMASLDYVEACLHETMRLKPVVPFHTYQALQDTTVADIQVSPDMVICTVMRHDGMAERYFPDPLRFDPQRWLGTGGTWQTTRSAKRVSMPFGGGPRICPGRYLALLEMKMATAMLLGSFDIESVTTPGGREAEEHASFAMEPVGLRMRLRERAT